MDLDQVRALRSLEVRVELLVERVSSTVSMSSLARDLERGLRMVPAASYLADVSFLD